MSAVPSHRSTEQRTELGCSCCGQVAAQPLFELGTSAYVECRDCGTARLSPLPLVDPSTLYDDGYFVRQDDRGGYLDYEHDAPMHRVNARRRAARCLAHYRSTAPTSERFAVDVGCASGFTLDAFRDAGFRTAGVDVSAWARQRCADRQHRAVPTLGDVADLAGSVGVVSFFQSLEHMADPAEAIATASELLEPGGVVIIETWDRRSTIARLLGARWHQVNPPTVLHHFTRDGLGGLLAANGLEVARVSATSKLVSPELIVGVLAQRSQSLGDAMLRFLRFARLSAVPIPYRAGDLITVTAVKRTVPVV